MGKKQILMSLYKGSNDDHNSYRRFLLESIKLKGWFSVVKDITSWLQHPNTDEVESALLDFIANDEITAKKLKIC